MGQPAGLSSAALQIFNHHLYELSKGLRPLAMMTMTADAAGAVIARLAAAGIAHHVHEACPDRVNVVFGCQPAVMAVRRFMAGPLCQLSAEHDFMLGVLLGYDRERQCVRYLARAENTAAAAEPMVLADAATSVVMH
ncbi:DUF2023 family protein [Blastochloris viridis]|uniref:DUF2023 domain-containing protein n=1 Tax=Blastochloris viridis TaxID=1079 RepID=A0A0H5BQ10_BLAVI|nr:DUF2023 family protein [Blastochloris viridis]ALK09914.1 hypothetical protein BVIR_2145 [Blastochloris viridis]BAS00179.1 hypothetical protein BV133_2585 [Blastochloris viridis]CUU42577.1 hypothetical protein BVIRIDIS_15900 [Blastochloris viridis]